MTDIDPTAEMAQALPPDGPPPGVLAGWAATVGMREGQLWTAVIALAVAVAVGIAGIPATVRSVPSTTTTTTTIQLPKG